MRWIGAVLIIFAGIFSGIIYFVEKKRRLNALEDVCAAFEIMGGDLQTKLSSLPELCDALKERANGAAQMFFENLSTSFTQLGEKEFSELWDESIGTSFTMLQNEELRQISALGKVLGRCEVERQLEALNSLNSYLRTGLENARNTYPQERKLGLGVGAAAAMLLALGLL